MSAALHQPKKNQEGSPEMQSLQDSDTPQVPKSDIGFWHRIAIYFAFLIPFAAACAKAFTNSYSTLSIFVFFTLGIFVVDPALFMGPLLIVICALGIATILVSINMEGRSLYEDLCGFIRPKKNKKFLATTPADKLEDVSSEDVSSENVSSEDKAIRLKQEELGALPDEPDALETYITGYLAHPFSWIDKKLKARFPKSWEALKKYAGPALTLFMFFLSSATKGFAMAPGIFNILGLASCGPWAWVILAFAVVAVMGVSAAKEGKKLLKQAGLGNKLDIETGAKPAPFWKKWLVYGLSGFLPLVAALAKAFGYSYGVLMLLAYLYTGSFAATAAVSAWMPLIIVVGVGLALVSLRMEGYALFKFFRRLSLSDDAIGLRTKYGIKDEFIRKRIKEGEEECLRKKVEKIEKILEKRPGWRWFERVTSCLFNYLIAYSLPALAFLGKASIMMVGTISAIVLLSGGMPITWWLLLIGAIAGLAVGLVSLQKEGKKTRACVHKYYTLLMYKCFVNKEARMQLPLFEDSYNIEPDERLDSKEILPERAKQSINCCGVVRKCFGGSAYDRIPSQAV